MSKPCERCGVAPPGGRYDLHDFCVHCSKDLCKGCIAAGKCHESPNGKHEVESDETPPDEDDTPPYHE